MRPFAPGQAVKRNLRYRTGRGVVNRVPVRVPPILQRRLGNSVKKAVPPSRRAALIKRIRQRGPRSIRGGQGKGKNYVASKSYHSKHGKKFHFGWCYFGGHHCHWSHCVWNHWCGCYTYYCPGACCWYYWCEPYDCYYPVTYCPTGTYAYAW